MKMMEEKVQKVYVQVKVIFTPDGQMRPRELEWEDGRKYKIDRVIGFKQAAEQRCGGQGDRYTIMVCGQQRYLFFERSGSISGNNIGRWFVACPSQAN
ncbi:MAG: hypothetical protein ACI4XJ_09765 [Eubacteriales bacterium]